MSTLLPKEAVDLILEFEGLDQPGRWPGGQSGVTLGHGYDLGYCSTQEFVRDWEKHLKPEEISRLKIVIGRKGSAAQSVSKAFRDVEIKREAAREVFESATLPKWTAKTRIAFPGVDLLPALAFGALVSIVFNRGASVSGARRIEMRRIRDLIIAHAGKPEAQRAEQLPFLLKEIAAQVRSMKRLWVGQGLDGLLRRREAEADLIESAV